MAVQAQYPSNAISPDNRSWTQAGSVLEDLHMMQSRQLQMGHPLLPSSGKAMIVGDSGQQVVGLPNNSVFSDHPQSELTCNASGSRKRIRGDQLALAEPPVAVFPQILHVPDAAFLAAPIALKSGSGGAVTSAFPASCQQSPRLFNSAATSTSGRQTILSAQSVPVPSSLPQELLAQIFQQNFENDALIRLQNERLRLTMEEARKRHCKSLLSILEQRVVKRLREKEIELENANRRNAELEEKINQMFAENQIWFNLAKNNEAIASNLRTNLEQVLENTAAAAVAPLREGYGDSDGTPFSADVAQSCCFEDKGASSAPATDAARLKSAEIKRRMACKICGGDDVCVLVLPCRHLCMCKDCETSAVMCPICNFPKKACLRIFMS